MFDRFDICEAYNVLGLDYGLYDVQTRLTRMHFRAGPTRDTYNALTDNGKEIYDLNAAKLDAGNSPIRSQFK